MKKNILLFVVFVFTLGLNAQKFIPSLYVGTSFTKYNDESSKVRWPLANMGFALEHSPLTWLSIRTGVEYAPKGDVMFGEYMTTIKTRYVDFPTLLKFSTHIKNETRGYLCLGIVPSVFINAVYKKEEVVDGDFVTAYYGDLTGFAKFDFAMLYGIGLEFESQYYIEIKLEKGLINVIDDEYPSYNLKNRMVNISIGINLGK